MKRQAIQDERVLAQRRKINSEANGFLMIALLGAVLVQQFILDAPFEQYIVEAICFFGISFYMIARHLMLGLNVYGENKGAKPTIILNSLVTGLVVTIVNGALNYSKYADKYQDDGIGFFIGMLAITFISATLCAFAVLALVAYMNKKNQAKIAKQMDESENEI